MKKFVFRYARVLQVRIEKENEVKNKLAKINQVIIEKEDELLTTQSQNEAFLVSVNDAMKTGVLASDMQALASNKAYLSKRLKTLTHELVVLKDERKAVQIELIEANKQRKVMEKLREKEIEVYKELEAEEEAKLVDQIVTYQSTKKKGEENG